MRYCILALFFAAYACGTAQPTASCTLAFKFSLDPEQVVPPSLSEGFGVADLSFCVERLRGTITLNLTEVVTYVHLHGPAAPGETGPLLFNLPLPMGSSVVVDISFPVELVELLYTNTAYVDVHTVAHPDGAIRGVFRMDGTGVTSSPWTAVKKLFR